MFFSMDEIKRITSPEYLHKEDDTVLLLVGLVEEIDAAGYRYEYEERAAILEYEGGMCRYDAERVAACEIMDRIKAADMFWNGTEVKQSQKDEKHETDHSGT